MRELSGLDKTILAKLAPELEGTTDPRLGMIINSSSSRIA
jgi:hypothetical protein